MLEKLPTTLKRATAAGLAAATFAWAPVPAAAESQLADLVEAVSPAVVTVLASETRERRFDRGNRFQGFGDSPFEEFFRRFGGPDMDPFRGPNRRQGLGSGFVVDPDGLIVTNHHVVEGADSVTVRFAGLGDFTAEVVGSDEQTDIALLAIEPDAPLPTLTLGNSDLVRPGEDVFAVGNPFGLGGTVTKGIVSATQRDIQAGPYVDFIQTDAAINRGNSGGPLFNMAGEVIGVNSAIYTPNGGSVGVGFAVAANIVTDVIEDLRDGGVVDRGWLGVRIQRVTPELATALGLDRPQGALVASVMAGGPSDGSLQPGDVILGFGARDVASSRDLPKLVGRTDPGEVVEMRVLRNSRQISVAVTVGAFDERDLRGAAEPRGRAPARIASDRLGATLSPMTEEARENIGVAPEIDGVVVTSVRPRGPAARAGLRVGDVILEIDRQRVTEPDMLSRALEDGTADSRLLLVHRRGNQIYLGLRLG